MNFDSGIFRLEKQLSSEMPDILMDKNQIEQVFVNLLLNAVQAIEDQGIITVSSYMTPDGDRVNGNCRHRVRHSPGTYDKNL